MENSEHEKPEGHGLGKKSQQWPSAVILASLSIICLASASLNMDSTKTWIFFFMLGGIFAMIFVMGFFSIPNNPVTIGLVTKWGERQTSNEGSLYITEGLNWLLFKGFVYDCILVNMTADELELPLNVIIIKDNSEVNFKTAVKFKPNQHKLISYLNNGGKEEVDKFLQNHIESEIRQWASGAESWEDILSSKNQKEQDLLKELRESTSIDELGIEITSFIIQSALPHGEVYEAQVKMKTEKAKKEMRDIEASTDVSIARSLYEEVNKDVSMGEIMTFKECFELTQQYNAIEKGNGFVLKGGEGEGGQIVSSLLLLAKSLRKRGGEEL